MCPVHSRAPGEGAPRLLKAGVWGATSRRAARFDGGKYMIFQQLRKFGDAARERLGTTHHRCARRRRASSALYWQQYKNTIKTLYAECAKSSRSVACSGRSALYNDTGGHGGRRPEG